MSSSTPVAGFPSQVQVTKFDMVEPMVKSFLQEMREFAKKKQDGIVSTNKVRLINRLLAEVKEALGEDPSCAYLDLLDEEALPENSDAVLILGQYVAAMDQFREKYYHHWYGSITDQWLTKELQASATKNTKKR